MTLANNICWREMVLNHIKKLQPDQLIGPLNDVEEKFAPKDIFVVGNTDFVQNHPRVSVIGTRKPSPQGIEIASMITQFLVENNVIVVSGLADGIDTVAHQTAISKGGKTIGVLGTPADQYYPAKNKWLQEKIGSEHLLITQFGTGAPIQRKNFPMRNRMMALISHASVIVEAGKSSGTQHQGWEALRLGRPLYILESLVDDMSLEWPQKLVEYGAQPLAKHNLEPLLEELPEPYMVMKDAFSF